MMHLYIENMRFDAIRELKKGEYRFSQKQALEAIGVDRFWLSNMVKAMRGESPDDQNSSSYYKEAFKVLQGMGFTMLEMPVKYSKLINGKNITMTAESLSLRRWNYL